MVIEVGGGGGGGALLEQVDVVGYFYNFVTIFFGNISGKLD